MIKKDLLSLIKKNESQSLEFTSKPTKEVGKSISAFANTNDGVILVGVSDDKRIVECPKNTEEKIANIAHCCKPSVYPEIKEVEVKGKTVYIVKVKKTESIHSFGNIAYKRVGTHDKPLSPEEVVEFARASGIIQFGSQVCEEATLEDLSKKKFNWYFRERTRIRKTKKPRGLSYEDLLVNIKAAVKTQKGIIPTNAGILFFARYPQRFFLQSKLRVVRFKGTKVIHPTLDRLDGVGTLWEMVEEAEDFIRKNIRLLGFRTEKSFRREDKFEYPIKALREAIINALIHRNYFELSDNRVFIFDDRVEVINPGTFPEGVTPEHPEHKAINPILCDLMYDIGFIEKYGSGIYMMRELCKEWGNKEPSYNLHPIQTKIVFESPVKESTLIEEKEKKRFILPGEDILNELNPRQVKVLEYTQTHKRATTSDCLKLFPEITKRTIRRDLKDLEVRGLLGKSGRTKGAFYFLPSKE